MSTFVITGAGRGIGLELTRRLLARGDRVIATVRSEAAMKKLDETLAEFDSANYEIYYLEVTDSKQVAGFAQSLANETVDVLINNAGVLGGDQQAVDNFSASDFLNTLAVNTVAPVDVGLALLPSLKKSAQPKLVTISSMMGSLARERSDTFIYRASKASVNKAMQAIGLALKEEKVGVFLMHPGWVKTDMGGPEADISVEECVSGLLSTIDQFTLEDSAKFWNYDGTPMAW